MIKIFFKNIAIEIFQNRYYTLIVQLLVTVVVVPILNASSLHISEESMYTKKVKKKQLFQIYQKSVKKLFAFTMFPSICATYLRWSIVSWRCHTKNVCLTLAFFSHSYSTNLSNCCCTLIQKLNPVIHTNKNAYININTILH